MNLHTFTVKNAKNFEEGLTLPRPHPLAVCGGLLSGVPSFLSQKVATLIRGLVIVADETETGKR
jgi:hypothetical protein